MRMNSEESYSTFLHLFGVLFVILEIYLVALVDCVGANEGGGFSVSRFPGLNLFALQCNGSHLPSDVRSVQYISLERYSPQPEVPPHIIASLSSVDGVRLENSYGNANVYVSGRFDGDNIHSTSLTVLLADVVLDMKVTYGCKISYIKRGGGLGVTERFLNVSFADLQTLYLLQSDDLEKHHHQQRLAQTPFSETKQASIIWTTPMILLMTMAILLFALFVVCVLLIVDRYRDHCRNRRRMNRMKRNKCDSKEQEVEAEPRPLPSPPSWTYPHVIGEPPPRSPYNRLRFGGVSRNLRDDTGYDSEASMHYCKPFDDVGEASAEKPPLQTFGKMLSPVYATPPNIINS